LFRKCSIYFIAAGINTVNISQNAVDVAGQTYNILLTAYDQYGNILLRSKYIYIYRYVSFS
jgi:hypothetical protein